MQPSRGVSRKSCSEDMQQICRRTPMPKCYFNKAAKQIIEITLWHEFSLLNLRHNFRTSFPKNNYGELLLIFRTPTSKSRLQAAAYIYPIRFKPQKSVRWPTKLNRLTFFDAVWCLLLLTSLDKCLQFAPVS